jgi:predicted transposase YbfD/YdcC
LDVTFKEDSCRARKDNTPENHSILQKLALQKETKICELQII